MKKYILVLSSTSFLFPLLLASKIRNARLRKGFMRILSAITGTSIMIHSGCSQSFPVLVLDKIFIYFWVIWNANVMRFRPFRSGQSIFFAGLVGLLGWTGLFQQDERLHALMHLSGSMGTSLLIRKILDYESANRRDV